jgi:phosphoglycerate dehydrogenase-like enzyme
MKVVVTASLGKGQLQKRLAETIGDKAIWVDDPAAAAKELRDADALLCPDHFFAKIAEAVRTDAPKLRWIQLLTSGYDHAKRLGVPERITVCNAGEAYAPAVATHAVTLLLALQRQMPAALANQPKHVWNKDFAAQAIIPAGRTIVVVGLGPIGREIARLLRAFGARIVAVTQHGRPDPQADEVVAVDRLAEVLPRADAVMLAAPYNESTRHLIGAREFALCKKTAILVNISRGGMVDAPALIAALKCGAIAGAGIDVTDPEPLPADDPLWDAPNLIITPHYAGACGPSAGDRLAELTCANLIRFCDGAPLQHTVPVGKGEAETVGAAG